MKVYTHYYKLDDGIEIRWRTLLQFGSSWDVIGSVVMKNPGSASPRERLPISDSSIIARLSMFDDSDTAWYEFSDDDTMRKVAVLFASYYGLDNVRKLKGVIQVFNLFYLRDADLEKAKNRYSNLCLPANFNSTDEMLEYDIQHLIPPVYLGFGDLAFSKEFGENARRYFEVVVNSGYPVDYLKTCFGDNKFYHPQYLCGSGCNNGESKYIRGKFKKVPMSDEDIKHGVPMPAYSMSNTEKLNIIQTLKDSYNQLGFDVLEFNPKDLKTIKFLLPRDLQITITATGGGYVAIRHTNIPKGADYSVVDYSYKNEIEQIAVNNGFCRGKGKSAWIGTKPLDSFYDAVSLLQQINDLKELFESVNLHE